VSVGKLAEIFRTMGWDIRANASVKGSKPPALDDVDGALRLGAVDLIELEAAGPLGELGL
jgi:hypothetical protein